MHFDIEIAAAVASPAEVSDRRSCRWRTCHNVAATSAGAGA